MNQIMAYNGHRKKKNLKPTSNLSGLFEVIFSHLNENVLQLFQIQCTTHKSNFI